MKKFTTPDKKLRKSLHSMTGVTQVCALLLFASLAGQNAQAQPAGPTIYTNESFIESVIRKSKLDLKSPKTVFQHVLNSLPDKVRVYPTEGYYYFHFYQDGVKYAGNIRLDVEERENGVVIFNYFKATNDWSYDDENHFTKFSAKDGVVMEKKKELVYQVTSEGKSVTFEINDLSSVVPPEGTVRKDEKYIGPILDEGGTRFFLNYNPKVKGFHYILDETGETNEELIKSKVSDNIFIGRRTGFAFYQEPETNRKILIAVHERNSSVNNYYDGPFDQLPDSFLKGDDLMNAILEITPELKGKVDRYGNFDGDARRYLIAPYMYYQTDNDMEFVDKCVKAKSFPDIRQCFIIPEQDEEEKPEGEDVADKSRDKDKTEGNEPKKQ